MVLICFQKTYTFRRNLHQLSNAYLNRLKPKVNITIKNTISNKNKMSKSRLLYVTPKKPIDIVLSLLNYLAILFQVAEQHAFDEFITENWKA